MSAVYRDVGQRAAGTPDRLPERLAMMSGFVRTCPHQQTGQPSGCFFVLATF
jgi:hypothetical protein